jgi:hypothetical protein
VRQFQPFNNNYNTMSNSNTSSTDKPAHRNIASIHTINRLESDSGSVSTSSASWANTEVVEPHTGYKGLVTGGAGFIGSHVAECLLPVVTMS